MSDPAQTPSGNHHCTVVELDGVGIAIEGPPGSGKTSLAFGLIESARMRKLPAHFICDDQALLEAQSGGITARAPEAIAGKAELHGFGIIDVDYKPETQLRLVARLTENVTRMPSSRNGELLGVVLSLIELPMRHENQAVRIVFAWLEANRADSEGT